jgi:hypothetical protein
MQRVRFDKKKEKLMAQIKNSNESEKISKSPTTNELSTGNSLDESIDIQLE